MTKKEILFYLLAKRKISLKRLINLLKVSFSFLFKKTRVLGLPPVLMVEPTNLCNLRCPLCPAGTDTLARPKGTMGLELFQKIIEELGDYIWHLTLWNWGEPFICPDIYEMITLAERKGIFTRISTNGHFLTAGPKVERLLTTGLDNLLVAIDGASEETFSLYRQKGDWEKVVAGLKEIMARKKRQRLFRPRVELQFMVMKHNEHELLRIQSLAREIGVDRLTFKTVNIKFGPGDNKEKIDKFLPQRNYLSRYQPHSTQRKVYLKNKCYRLWFSSVINWDGTVTPCCYDAPGRYSFGRIQEKGFSQVWNNTAYRQFRTALLKDKKVIGLCQDCPGLLMGLNLSL